MGGTRKGEHFCTPGPEQFAVTSHADINACEPRIQGEGTIEAMTQTIAEDETYLFGNGVEVFRRHLLDFQVSRYLSEGNRNLHEPVEEDWFLRVIDSCNRPNLRFCDIGGGIGYYTLLLLKLRTEAEATVFEFLPAHISAIRENLALNGISPSRMTLIEAAAHVSDGVVEISERDFSSHVVIKGLPVAKGRRDRVPARDLAALLAAEPAPFDIAKLDVQGGEATLLSHVVESGQARQIRNWIIGTHGEAIFAECLDILSPHWRILHQDPNPPHQPDGLIVATLA